MALTAKPASMYITEASYTSIPEAVADGCLTPPNIAKAYNIPYSDGTGITVGIISFGGGFLQDDINKSMTDLGLTAPTINFKSVNGSTNNFVYTDIPSQHDMYMASIENTLDIYCVASVVPNAIINIYIANNGELAQMLLQALDDNCDLITISWGFPENLLIQYPLDQADIESAFLRLKENQIPVLVAAGDYGSTPLQSTSYVGVQYPASSPNVIAIGGTYLLLNSDSSIQLEAAYNFFQYGGGGGGISEVFAVPTWQNGVKYTTYSRINPTSSRTVTLTSGTKSSFPIVGRGIPDISAPFNDYAFYFNDNLIIVGGTSAATPALAGFMARTKQLTSKSLSSVDYNTMFYKNSSMFNDINLGNDASWISTGYQATDSWDPVVGWGSVKGRGLYRCSITDTAGTPFPYSNGSQRPSTGSVYPRTKTINRN